MKIVLYSRAHAEHNEPGIRMLFEALREAGSDYTVNREFAMLAGELADETFSGDRIYDISEEACCPDAVAVSYGGDGTFLECVRLLGRFGMPVLGINSGRVGFLANVPLEGMKQAFTDLAAGKYEIQKRTLIKAEGGFPARPDYPYAFNEFSIQRSGTSMISVETYVDGEMVATYWGDGVILSTPSGSTAYSLSVGGPVVAPECSCFVLAPIAPHNLTMRPVVVPDTGRVTFRVRSRDGAAYATIDNTNFLISDGAEFSASRAENSVFLVRLQNISFYDTLRNKMLWGLDPRETAVK